MPLFFWKKKKNIPEQNLKYTDTFIAVSEVTFVISLADDCARIQFHLTPCYVT